MGLSHLITCVVAGIDYLVHPHVLGTIEEAVASDSLLPVVLLGEAELNVSPDELEKTLKRFIEIDDVCSEGFTDILVIKPSTGADHLLSLGSIDRTNRLFSSAYQLASGNPGSPHRDLPSGPYFLSGRNLHQAWRLYGDDLGSFVFGLIPDDVFAPKEYKATSVLTQDGITLGIPVPSRLYHSPSPDKPLAGMRVGIKDIIDIRGVKTALSSRAYSELYSIRTQHAPFAETLIETGAIIVGKTKTSQFATATQWIDFHRPRNPRGDFYQEPSGSSTGGAAALAGYSWLDHSIGGDSSGSVREPSTWHGLFGIRPTFGITCLKGIAINSPRYDTIGMFGRSLDDLYMITQTALNVAPDKGRVAKRILYPLDFYPLADAKYQELTEEFVRALEKSLGIKRTTISLADMWHRSPPHEAQGLELQEYMDEAPFLSLCYDYSHRYQPFVEEYRKKFGRDPFIEDSPSLRWNIGLNVTEEEYQGHLERNSIFKKWFTKHVMAETGPLSDTILVVPFGIAEPIYIDEPPQPPLVFKGIVPHILAPVLGAPHVVAPFAQMPYESRISGRTEYRPICGSVLSNPGNDLMIIRTIHGAFKAMGWRDFVDTGRFTFPVGNNSRNVDDGDGITTPAFEGPEIWGIYGEL